ncbi:hypothetical protein O3M35_005518 [Rhynocoris fuscipes]|uniref:Kinesin motor domain-containing protein n=1 Tax=Rhynocoris fuscipes TaxID=488301 RepID=A0AAW1DIY5_9HEMI
MLATISPCSSHLEETLSTLRYASQARSIVNTVRINEGPQDRLIRELKAEVERLNSEMEKNRHREVNVQSSSEEVENLPSEEVEKLRKETVEAKVQVEMMNNETFRYQQQMTNIMKQNDHLSEQVYEKNKQLEESKIQIETLNKELKPMNALLSATQNELQENVNKIDLLNKEIAQLQSSHEEFKQKYQDLIKRNNDLEEKLNLEQSENDKVFSKKNELIENLKSENNLLKSDLNTARNELHQMKSIIDDKIVLSKDEKLEMDSKLKNKDEDLCLTKEKNEKLKVDLKQAHSDIKKLQSKINEERKKVESFDKLSKELDQIKDENKQLKEKVHKKKNKEIIELKSDKEVLEKNLFNANEKLINAENQLDKNKQTSLENIQLIKEYEQEIQKLKDENNSLDTNLKNIDVKLQKTKNLIDENNKNSNAINLENEKLILEKDKEIKNIKEENIFYRNESAKALEQINDLKKQLEELSKQGKTENDKLKKEIEKYAKEIKAMKNDYKVLEEKHSKAVKDLENVHLQDKTVSENALQQKNIEIDKLLKENESLKSELNQLKEKCHEITTELNRTNEKIEKEKLKMIEEKMNEIKTLKEDNSLLKKQQCSTRDELLKALSIIEQKSHKLEVLENEKQQIIDDKCKIVGQLQLEITELHNAIDASNNKLRNIENNLLLETNRKVELEDKLKKLENKFKALEEDKTILESRVKNAEHLRQNLQTELSWMAGERSFSEYQIETNKNKDKASFKHAVMMKDVEVYGFITDNLYPHHWEHLTRKARDYAEKYKIPYEFEKGEDCVIVRHLMLSASTTLNHFQFNQWLEKIEKNNLWFREMDKDWPWEVDFRDYFTHESDKPLEFVDNENGFLDPIVWRDTMLRRHVRGIREDVDALIVHFSSTEDSLIYSILSRLKAAADRLEEVTVNRNLKK